MAHHLFRPQRNDGKAGGHHHRARFRAPPPAIAIAALYTTFDRYVVTTDNAPQTNGYVRGHTLARAPDGTLWVLYLDTTRRYYYAKYSTNEGATWSAPELVWDSGAANARSYPVQGIFIGTDGQPMAQCPWWTGSVENTNFFLAQRVRNQRPLHAARRDVVARQPQARGGYSTFSGRQGGTLPWMRPSYSAVTAHRGSTMISPPPLGTGVGYSWSGMGWDGLVIGGNIIDQNPVWMNDNADTPTYWYRGYVSTNGFQNQMVVQRSPAYSRRPWPMGSDYNALWSSANGQFAYSQQSSAHWFMDKYKNIHTVVGGIIDTTVPSNRYGMAWGMVRALQYGEASGALSAVARQDIANAGPVTNVAKPLVVRGCIDDNGIVHAIGHWQNTGTISGNVYNTWWVYGDPARGDWYPPRPHGGAEVYNNEMYWTRIALQNRDPIFVTAQAGVSSAYPTKKQLLVYQTRRIPCNANHQPDMNANRRVPPRTGGSTIFCGRAGGVLRRGIQNRYDRPQHGGRISVCGPTYSGQDIAWTRTIITNDNKNWQTWGEPIYSRVGQYQAPLSGGFQFLAANDVDTNTVYHFNFGGLRTIRSLPDNNPQVHTINLEKSPQRRALEQGRRMGWRLIQPTLFHPIGRMGYPWKWTWAPIVENKPAKIGHEYGFLQMGGKKRKGRVNFSGPPTVASGASAQTVGSQQSPQGIRTSDGRLWVVFTSQSRRYVCVRYSRDNGVTWSRDELVYDTNQTAATSPMSLKVGNDGRLIVIWDDIAPTNTRRFFRREFETAFPFNARHGQLSIPSGARPQGRRGGYTSFTGRRGATLVYRGTPTYDKPVFGGSVNTTGPDACNRQWNQRSTFALANSARSFSHILHQSDDGVWHYIHSPNSGSGFSSVQHYKSFDDMATWVLVWTRTYAKADNFGYGGYLYERNAYDAAMARNGDIHLVTGPNNLFPGSDGIWHFGLVYEKYEHHEKTGHRVMNVPKRGTPDRKGGFTIFCGRSGGVLQQGIQTRYDRPQHSGYVTVSGPNYSTMGKWSANPEQGWHSNHTIDIGSSAENYAKPYNVQVILDKDEDVHVGFFMRTPGQYGGFGSYQVFGVGYATRKYGKGQTATSDRGGSTGGGWTTEFVLENPLIAVSYFGYLNLLDDGLTPYFFVQARGLQGTQNAAIDQLRYYERDWQTYQLKAPVQSSCTLTRATPAPQRKGGHTTFCGRAGYGLYALGQKLVDRPLVLGNITLIARPTGPVYRDLYTRGEAVTHTGSRNAWKRGEPVWDRTFGINMQFSVFRYESRRPWSYRTRGPVFACANDVTPFRIDLVQRIDGGWATPRPPSSPGTIKPLYRKGNDQRPHIGYRWTGDGPWLRLALSGALIQVLSPTIVRPNRPHSKVLVPGFVWLEEPPPAPKGSVSTFVPKAIQQSAPPPRSRIPGVVWISRRVLGRRKPHVYASGNVVGMSIVYKPETEEVLIRAWIENVDSETRVTGLDPVDSYAVITDHEGVELARALGQADGLGPEYVAFTIPAALAADHRYRVAVVLSSNTVFAESERVVPVVTVR